MLEIKQDEITKDYFIYEDGNFICMTAESKENAERIVKALEKSKEVVIKYRPRCGCDCRD